MFTVMTYTIFWNLSQKFTVLRYLKKLYYNDEVTTVY